MLRDDVLNALKDALEANNLDSFVAADYVDYIIEEMWYTFDKEVEQILIDETADQKSLYDLSNYGEE